MLEEYENKRNFSRTPEPHAGGQKGEGPLTFVIQKHAARRLHYDLRLELDGVLKSWAVPNGPSTDPGVKRLAVMVEDHPLDYSTFEGPIPKGEYGAGQVIVWDTGFYSPEEEGRVFFEDRAKAQEIAREGLEKGKISIFLRGQRLKGSWALVKMQHTQKDWLLLKHDDEFAATGQDNLEEDSSILSGLSLEDIKKGIARPSTQPEPLKLENLAGAQRSGFPDSISPMLASLVAKPFSDPQWFFEPKLDGYRLLTFVRDRSIKLMSRNSVDVTKQYPFIAQALKKQSKEEMVLDGEVTALDENGRSCFQCLQNHLNAPQKNHSSNPIIYYVFDILYLNGYDVRNVPLYLRKKLLEQSLVSSGYVRLVEYFEDDGATIYEAAVNQGLEGVIAKRKDSLYETGRRSRNWLKIKSVLSDEFIIGGYTRGSGNRRDTLGALLLGTFDNSGKLVFTGHVGTGWDEKTLKELRKRLDEIQSDHNPFRQNPLPNAPATWVRPELVAEIKYSERTQEGLLRTPVFLRLREDKPLSEVKLTEAETGKSLSDSVLGKAIPQGNDKIEDILSQLKNQRENFSLEVDGYQIKLSNADKVLWPAENELPALTKRDLLVYLTRISPFILPHLHDRPLTLTRYPNGIFGERFYQKHWDNPAPEFLKIVSLAEHGAAGRDYLVCNNLATLLWLGQMANIDLHTWFSRITPEPALAEAGSPENNPDFFTNFPDFIIFDLDPYIYSGKESKGAEPELNPEAFHRTCESALWLKEILESLSLHSFVKTSGRTGLHIFVPILRQFDYSAVHSAARTISGFLIEKHTRELTMDWAVEKRTGKIFLDYNQNVRGKTVASVYSPRPAPHATVSTPLSWEEVGKIYPTGLTILSVPERLAKIGDIWAGILDNRNDLKNLLDIKD